MPAFHGNPNVTITAINVSGGIDWSRDGDTIQTPGFVQVSASAITAVGTSDPYGDLEYSWDFGDSAGTERFINPATGSLVNANSGQTGPEATYCYRTAGPYTITLRIRGKNGNDFTAATATRSITVSAFDASGGTYYFDNTLGDDDNPGTEAEPKQTMVALRALLGNNRQFWLKRGEVWDEATAPCGIGWTTQASVGTRIGAYGSGAKPVIQVSTSGSGNTWPFRMTNQATKADLVISDLLLRSAGTFNNQLLVGAWGQHASNTITNLYFDNVDLHIGSGTSVAALTSSGGQDDFTSPSPTLLVNKTGIWKMSITTDPAVVTTGGGGALAGGRWASLVGVTFQLQGPATSNGLEHYIYAGAVDHLHYRWLKIDPTNTNRTLSYAFNGDIDTVPSQRAIASWSYNAGELTVTVSAGIGHGIQSNNVTIFSANPPLTGGTVAGGGRVYPVTVLTPTTFKIPVPSDPGVFVSASYGSRHSRVAHATNWFVGESLFDSLRGVEVSNGSNNAQNNTIGPVVLQGNGFANIDFNGVVPAIPTYLTLRDSRVWGSASGAFFAQTPSTSGAAVDVFNGKNYGPQEIVRTKIYRNDLYFASDATGGTTFALAAQARTISSIEWEADAGEPLFGGYAVVTASAAHNYVIDSTNRVWLTGQTNEPEYSGHHDAVATGTSEFKFPSADHGTANPAGSYYPAYRYPVQFTYNTVWDARTTTASIFSGVMGQIMTVPGSVVDFNQYFTPDTTFLIDGATSKTFAEWQALTGNPDANSTNGVQPNWPDPANGVFGLKRRLM